MRLNTEHSTPRGISSNMTVQRALKLFGVLVFASWISAVCLCFAIFGSPSLTNTAKYLAGQAIKVPYTWDDTETLQRHPIKDLVRKAVDEFEEQLARQSKTIEEAAYEYIQRYNRDITTGFEMW